MELAFEIIEVLKEYSSERKTLKTGPMSQNAIRRKLVMRREEKNENEITSRDKPTLDMVRPVLKSIVDAELNLPDEQKTVRYKTGKNGQRSGYWYANTLSDAELKFLVDSALTSRMLSTAQGQALAKKIQGLANKRVRDATAYARVFGDVRAGDGPDVLKNLDILVDAIDRDMVEFRLCVYGADKKLRALDKVHIVHPYRIIMNNGKYYLLAGYDGSDEVYRFRVDLMTAPKTVPGRAARSRYDVPGMGSDFNYADYLMSHPVMMGGDYERATLRVERESLTQVMDSFGDSVWVLPGTETETTVDVSVTAAAGALRAWLMQYADIAIGIRLPDRLRKDLWAIAERMYTAYSDMEENADDRV